MVKLGFGATLFFAFVQVSFPLHAQGTISLQVCNAGTVDIDAVISQAGKVSSSHVGPADCAIVAKSAGAMGRTYVGLAFVDARKQWGAARRLDVLPFFGEGVLDPADQSVPVTHGNATVSLPMQMLFQPPAPSCSSPGPTNSAQMNLPIGATQAQVSAARSMDRNAPRGETICATPIYTLNVFAYPDSREITFRKFCDPCDKKAESLITPEERAAKQRRAAATTQVIRSLSAAGVTALGAAVNLGNDELEKERKERQKELEPGKVYLRVRLGGDFREPQNRRYVLPENQRLPHEQNLQTALRPVHEPERHAHGDVHPGDEISRGV